MVVSVLNGKLTLATAIYQGKHVLGLNLVIKAATAGNDLSDNILEC